jgi:5-methylcytosine-specific restriction endonuclease McrA
MLLNGQWIQPITDYRMPSKPITKERPWNIKRASKPFEGRTKRDPRYKTYRWQQLRKQVLGEQDWICQECIKKDKLKHGKICDHISNEERRKDFWNKDNLQCLCTRCHNRKSQSERGVGSTN